MPLGVDIHQSGLGLVPCIAAKDLRHLVNFISLPPTINRRTKSSAETAPSEAARRAGRHHAVQTALWQLLTAGAKLPIICNRIDRILYCAANLSQGSIHSRVVTGVAIDNF